ncbi:unnamed protein product [Chironomus riparius]|uniref:Uncharacterized protein n=1 Tax=Chironomus riparius TaxID=315576 RepID=A0A9N9S652_9DIPT|nr:unnamed protein product [Chironomus riparius]
MKKCCKFTEMKRKKIDQSFWNIVKLVRYLIFSLIIDKAIATSSFGITLNCSYRTSSIPWPVLGEIYECYIERDLFITHAKMPISDAVGEHKSWKNAEKVVGFYARSAEVHYFPNGLEKIFPNLRLIAIAMSNLREVRQQNLIPFDQLQYLCLFDNEIETIEKHLFAYNLMLEAIDLRENRIVRINVNVFDYLINLRILYLSDSFNGSCVSEDAADRASVVRLINGVKNECNDRAFYRLSHSEKSAMKGVVLNVTQAEDTVDRDEADSSGFRDFGSVWCIFLGIICVNFTI